MSKLIDFESYPISPVLDRLLQDKTTKQNIIFATDAYLENGPDFAETAQITVDKLLGYMKIKIQPRVEKAAEEQLARTRKKAEVFTPSWIEEQQLPIMPICRVMDWRKDCSISYDTIRGGKSE